MFPFKVFLFLITICVAKSEADYETMCKNDYRDEKNNQIDVLEYCSNKLCVEKCCGPTKMLRIDNKCINKRNFFNIPKSIRNAESKYNAINILSSLDVTKKSKNFVFLQNHRNFHKCAAEHTEIKDYDISEDGSLRWQDNKTKKWKQIKKLLYCIEYKTVIKNNDNDKLDIKIVVWPMTKDPGETKDIETFKIVALLISSFFLMLVLVVYCLLPDLRNLSGLVLMAYTFSLFFAFVNTLIQDFIKRDPPEGFCKRFSPVVYFAFLSSIFWLNVMSFDVWWVIRSLRYKRNHKRSKLVKFMWYGLFAWGTPLLITAVVITLDNIVYLDIVEPPFKDCLMDNGESWGYYFKLPIGILIFINIVLFVMTVYNMWKVKHAINKCHDSRSSKQQNTRFATYAKLSVIMGPSWCLELLPHSDMLWVYMLLNLYNLLTGIVIFYLYVCEKKILLQLCKKFNIRNDFTKKLESTLSQHTKSGITSTTGVGSSIVKNMSKDENQETDLLKNCP